VLSAGAEPQRRGGLSVLLGLGPAAGALLLHHLLAEVEAHLTVDLEVGSEHAPTPPIQAEVGRQPSGLEKVDYRRR
jgi:hypothetical protein